MQQQGPIAITRKSVADELKLTADQQKQVADIQTQANTDRRAAMQGVDFQNMSDDDRQKMMTKMQDVQKAEGDKILAVLTDAQKTQWKTMQGTPFTFPAPVGPGAAPAAAAARGGEAVTRKHHDMPAVRRAGHRRPLAHQHGGAGRLRRAYLPPAAGTKPSRDGRRAGRPARRRL